MKSPTLFRTAKSSALLTKVLNAWNKIRKPVRKQTHNKIINDNKNTVATKGSGMEAVILNSAFWGPPCLVV
jgi:methyl coenzyme M reductase beta subunit